MAVRIVHAHLAATQFQDDQMRGIAAGGLLLFQHQIRPGGQSGAKHRKEYTGPHSRPEPTRLPLPPVPTRENRTS